MSETSDIQSKRIVALLPEGKLFDQVFSDSIAAAAAEANLSVVRLDAQFSSENKLGSICTALEAAELVIADLTGKNPNIMYQIGYAHGIGRKVLLIAQHTEDFPFNKAKHEIIAYAGDRQLLRAELMNYFRNGRTLAKAEGESSSTDSSAPRERFLSTFGDILSAHRHEHHGEIYLENPTTFVLVNQDMDLALVQELARRARELGLRLKLM